MRGVTTVKIRSIINYLEQCGYIVRRGEFSVLSLTASSKEVLSGEKKLTMKMPKESQKSSTAKKRASDGIYRYDTELFSRLKRLRTELAEEAGMPAYIIFTDSTLRDMCVRMPRTLAQLLDCSGIGKNKQERYGEQILKVINGYLEDNPQIAEGGGESSYLEKIRRNRGLGNGRDTLFSLIRDNADKLTSCGEMLTMSGVCDRFLECLEISADKSIVKSAIKDWLVGNNYLKASQSGKADTELTILSEEAGIEETEKVSKLGTRYKQVVFPQSAQNFLIENVGEIFR